MLAEQALPTPYRIDLDVGWERLSGPGPLAGLESW